MLAGDVMLGRGIDQIQPFPGPPDLYEQFVKSAQGYVALAEEKSGPIPRAVPPSYIWGQALEDLETHAPDLRMINLETAVTLSGHAAPKGINYRMNPANLACLKAASIDCCVLANNHVLDWGPEGLADTLAALDRAGIARAGAGADLEEAQKPAILHTASAGRLVVHAVGCPSSGVPPEWAAGPHTPGVHVVTGRLDKTATRLADKIAQDKRPGDIVMLSIHWGSNWGYSVAEADREFAHFLIDRAGVDIVHGHSSHHPKAIEIYRGRPILYGCGDLLNDYEGISGYESYRSDLVLIYLVSLASDGTCSGLELLPYRISKFQLSAIEPRDRHWLAERLDRESACFGGGVILCPDGRMVHTYAVPATDD